jgi:hypothetical protein
VNDNLATKQDFLALKQELKTDMRELEHRLTLRMGTLLSVAGSSPRSCSCSEPQAR